MSGPARAGRPGAFGLGLGLVGLGLFGLTLGCAAQHEEAPGAEPSVDAGAAQDLAEASAPEPAAVPDAEGDEMGERSLAEIERELAANEARLRSLGVPLARAGEAPTGAETKQEQEGNLGGGKAKNVTRPSAKPGASAGSGGVPSASPSSPSKQDGGDSKSTTKPKDAKKENRKDKDRSKGKDAGADGDDRFAQPPSDEPRPDAAKAAPPGPNTAAPLDAAQRCEQICELGQITCELSLQICELAERHEDDEDYRSACERSVEDCEAAQEACDACES